jgi:hypothetical protein
MQVLGLGGQLAVGLGLDHPQQQLIGLVAVIVWIQLQQGLGQVEGGDQNVWRYRQRLAEALSPSGQGTSDHQQAAEAAQGKGVLGL